MRTYKSRKINWKDKDARNEYFRSYYREHSPKPPRVRRINKCNQAHKWGITDEQYDTYVRKGKCHICGEHVPRGMHIDHCHKTGERRGVLCRECNHGLGNFKDNPALLEAAAAYLRKPR